MVFKNFPKNILKIFPVPKSLAFDFVGIDVCQNSVRVMKLKKTKIGKIPVKYHEYPLKQGCNPMRDLSNFENHEELVGILKTIKRDFNVEYVNVSIQETNTYVYKTTLPVNIGYNILSTLEFSVEENVPISPKDTLLDYFVLDVKDDVISVIVTVVSKSIIEKFTEIIESAGLKPVSFEPETHAIARGIFKSGHSDQCLILNLDKCVSSVAIVENGIVQYTQTIPVTNDFSEKFDEEDAQILKESLKKIIIYWSTSIDQADKDEITNMFLVGENARSHDLLNFLEKNVSLNVKFANVWTNCFDLNQFIPAIHAKDALRYASTIGLALKRIK